MWDVLGLAEELLASQEGSSVDLLHAKQCKQQKQKLEDVTRH